MKFAIVTLSALIAIGCSNAASPVASNSSSAAPASNEKGQTVIAHSTENKALSADGTTAPATKWKQSGDPIDTKPFDTAIAAAEVAQKKSPSDAAAKKALADAYYKRADALTAARQYASALGDYRRTIKYDPSNAEAKDWIEKIIAIYSSMNRESPPEGEEPAPLTNTKAQ
ncbi:hypothetical protein BH10ACI3_BH10ACI3_06070 [soil metagenome]